MNKIPITNVGKETPNNDTARIKSLKKPFLFIQAVQFVDIPIMSAYLVFIAFVFVMINFIVDILYYFIDPRIRVKGDSASG